MDIPKFTYLIKDKVADKEKMRSYIIVKDEQLEEKEWETVNQEANQKYKEITCLKTPNDEVVKVEDEDSSSSDSAIVISKKMYNNLKNMCNG